jgi:hypothetical protein
MLIYASLQRDGALGESIDVRAVNELPRAIGQNVGDCPPLFGRIDHTLQIQPASPEFRASLGRPGAMVMRTSITRSGVGPASREPPGRFVGVASYERTRRETRMPCSRLAKRGKHDLNARRSDPNFFRRLRKLASDPGGLVFGPNGDGTVRHLLGIVISMATRALGNFRA